MAERVPGYWWGFVRFAQKAAVMDFALEQDVFSLSDFFFGRSYSWMVTGLGENPEYGSELLVYNLAIDPDELADLSDDDLASRLAERPKPVRAMRANAGPVFLTYEDTPEHIRDEAPGFEELSQRAARVKGDSALCDRLIAAFVQTREEREASPHVEEQIYDGFASSDDQAIMDRFHDLDWSARLPLLEQLSDERLRSLGKRLVHIEAHDVMEAAARRDYDVVIARRLMADDTTVPWLTLPKAIEEADDLLAVATEHDAALLREHREYLVRRAEEVAELLA